MKLNSWRLVQMTSNEFNKMLEERKDYKQIIYDYINLEISLTSKQLEKVIKLKKQDERKCWKNQR